MKNEKRKRKRTWLAWVMVTVPTAIIQGSPSTWAGRGRLTVSVIDLPCASRTPLIHAQPTLENGSAAGHGQHQRGGVASQPDVLSSRGVRLDAGEVEGTLQAQHLDHAVVDRRVLILIFYL